ncbi:hypothetical protein tb265_05380 [Gemmatimonadetes bacterium T265]|nr:hypothetical protein tb265_05380 [Gemmatimonadetes bacterium T265]
MREPGMNAPAYHVALVGLPGAGKSTVGRLTARQLGVPFVDFDVELVARTGLSVADQFAILGEAAFRAAEADLARELATAPPAVLAPGGGWMTNSAARTALDASTCTVYLRVSPPVAAARLAADPTVRPLVAGTDPAGALAALLARRTATYDTAHTTIDTDARSADAVAAEVVAAVRAWQRRPARPTEVAA